MVQERWNSDTGEGVHSLRDVLEEAKGISLETIQEAIESQRGDSAYDPKAGIQLVEMKDSSLTRFRLDVGGKIQELRPYAVKVAPGQRVRGHWHTVGPEIYGMPKGAGADDFRMYMGNPAPDLKRVHWSDEPTIFVPGESFNIPTLRAHSLVNKGATDLYFVVYCDPTHVAKGEGEIKEDRIFADNQAEV